MNEEVVGIQKTPLVYSRRRRENVINPTSLPYCQSPSLEKGIILNPSTPSNSLIKSDLDIPIANRKGVRACTKYPLAYFVSYHHLGHNHKAFTTALSSETIPKNIIEILGNPI